MTVPFLTVKPKSIKLKVSPRFPAQLLGGVGIDVEKANGNYTIDLDVSGFLQIAAPPISNEFMLVYNSMSNIYALAPVSTLPGYTVATLPIGTIGTTVYVTDGAASLAWGATVTGGGSTKYLVWFNGANWTVAGK